MRSSVKLSGFGASLMQLRNMSIAFRANSLGVTEGMLDLVFSCRLECDHSAEHLSRQRNTKLDGAPAVFTLVMTVLLFGSAHIQCIQ